MRKLRILVDMDGVLCHWSKAFDAALVRDYPHLTFPHLAENRSWEMGRGGGPEVEEAIRLTKNLPDFYRELEPIEGGKEALEAMVAAGHEVLICTSPWVPNVTCASDKLHWLETYIGEGWGDKAIITGDKTVIKGDYLIDDRPEITGLEAKPEWEQIIFDASYNRTVTGLQRLTDWSDWKEVLQNAEDNRNRGQASSGQRRRVRLPRVGARVG